MKLRALRIPALVTAVAVAGLTIGTFLPSYEDEVAARFNAASTPAPSYSLPPSLTVPPCQEDEPCWDCTVHGNRICGSADLDERTKEQAWGVFDAARGAAKLVVDPSREYRVDFVGYATAHPALTDGQVALVGTDGRWYVFTANYSN